jgi:hypothetical protein
MRLRPKPKEEIEAKAISFASGIDSSYEIPDE